VEFGACYCALYVRKDVYEGKTELKPVPERRPLEKQSKAYSVASVAPEERTAVAAKEEMKAASEVKPKLWYCKQCGYVVFRDEPPYTCPVCKAKKEMFAEIKTRIDFVG
jgi:ferredoxin-thioredoxin reductase catalytic chain